MNNCHICNDHIPAIYPCSKCGRHLCRAHAIRVTVTIGKPGAKVHYPVWECIDQGACEAAISGEKEPHKQANEQNDTIDVSWLISLISDALKEGKAVADKVARGPGGREISLCITKLQEARHWAVDAMMLLQPSTSEDTQEGAK